MAVKELKADDYEQILESFAHSRKTLEHYRKARRERIELYAGADYSEETGQVPRPLNMIRQYVDIIGRSLVSKNPRGMYSTFNKKQRPAVRGMQDWLNKHIVRIDLASVLQRCVVDAFFQVGIGKVALATPADAAASAYGLEPGDPYACSISLNDFVYDVFAQSQQSLQYVGHWARVPIDAVKDSKAYGPGRRKLEPTDKRQHGPDGDEVASTLSGWASRGTKAEAFPSVDLLEIYLPRHKRLLTFGSDGAGEPKLFNGKPLRDVPWVGPRCGPIHWLGFGSVPDCVMPPGTILNLTDLDVAINDCFRKLWRQAQRAKEVDAVQSSATEDGKALRDARDGDMPVLRDLAGVAKIKTGGPMPELVAFLGVLRELFNFMAGNPAAVGGLQQQADTATQEKLLTSSASAGVNDMQGDVVKFTCSMYDALGWFFWENPFKVMHTEYQRKGLPQALPRRIYPAGEINPRTGRRRALTREMPYEELDKRLDPYSIGHQTPQQRAAKLRSLFTQLVAPIFPLFQQMGMTWDMEKFMGLLGEYEDEPDYKEIMGITDPVEPDPASGGASSGSGMPVHSSREYRRTDSGKEPSATETAVALMGSAQKNGKVGGLIGGAR